MGGWGGGGLDTMQISVGLGKKEGGMLFLRGVDTLMHTMSVTLFSIWLR